ncbi:MAG: hypothetical protein GC181_13825 [Bacteroidetes bacterium]|nr:hypothetical protein [Bacteroidota bacterium]
MQVSVIRALVGKHTMHELVAAEEALLNEEKPAIEIPGADEGEQLTHILAVIWIQHDMEHNQRELKDSLRDYTQKVRKSIN